MRKLIVASAFAALTASAPAMAASPGGSVGGGAAGGAEYPPLASPLRAAGGAGRFDRLKKHQHAVHTHGSTRALDKSEINGGATGLGTGTTGLGTNPVSPGTSLPGTSSPSSTTAP